MSADGNKISIQFTLNGMAYDLWVKPNLTLQDLLRENLGFTGTKKGCESGVCGSCTVLLDGNAVNSCLVLVPQIGGKSITTIEGLGRYDDLDPLQQEFVAKGAIQCGYCTPGMILAAKDLLKNNPTPSEPEIRTALRGNLCRCTGYVKIIDAIQAVAAQNRSSRPAGLEGGQP